MTTLLILGGTGHTGAYVAATAARRGYEVVSVSRNEPTEPIPGVTYRTGDLLDAGFRESATDGADVIVSALSPRGDLTGNMVEVGAHVADLAAASDATFVVVGTFSDLRASKGSPRYLDAGMPEQYAVYDQFTDEGNEMAALLDLLSDPTGDSADWIYVSPAAEYGQWRPGEERGTYRLSDEVALFDENGESFISSADFGSAILDVIESGAHRRSHVSVAY